MEYAVKEFMQGAAGQRGGKKQLTFEEHVERISYRGYNVRPVEPLQCHHHGVQNDTQDDKAFKVAVLLDSYAKVAQLVLGVCAYEGPWPDRVGHELDLNPSALHWLEKPIEVEEVFL